MNLISLKTELRQELKLTPQLLQSMEVLQMNSQELLDYLGKLSEENPTLELSEASELRSAYAELRQKASWLDAGTFGTSFAHEEDAPPEPGATDKELDSLSAFLCDQLERKRLPKPMLALCKYMAELVDEDGYLTQEDLDGLTEMKIPQTMVDQALDTIQSLEPAGVGARDLSECLVLQLSRRKDNVPYAMDIAARFLTELSHKHYGPISKALGITVPDQTMIDILQRLEFTVDVQADGSWDVSAPLYRDDVESFPDLAEEVIREYGYDHIVPTFLNTASVTNGGLNYDQKQQLKTKRLLAAQGFYEASTLAFYSNAELDMLHIPADDAARKAIRILNPISENLSIMRTLLTPSMLNVIVDNLKKGNAEGRLFEMAPVYLAKELPLCEHPHERQTLCIGAFGPEEDFFTVKGAMEALAAGFGLHFTYERETAPWLHPGISAAVYCGGKRLGVFGKLSNEINGELEIAKEQKDSQNIYLGELDYEALMSCVDGELRYQPLSPYAAVKRDLALVCEEQVTCGEIEETIKKASPLITDVKLFDIYRGANLGAGKKSMAFSLTLSDPSAEVSAEQVERTVKKVLGNLKFKLGIEIR